MVIRFPRCPETIKSDGTQRQIMVICPLFKDVNVFRSRLLQCRSVRRYYLATFCPTTIPRTSPFRGFSWLMPSHLRWECWMAVTNYCHPLPLPSRDNQVCWHAKTNYGHPLSSASRDNQVCWHVETNYGHLPPFLRLQCLSIETIKISLCLPETIKFVGTRRQIIIIRFPRHPETIKSVGTWRKITVIYPLF